MVVRGNAQQWMSLGVSYATCSGGLYRRMVINLCLCQPVAEAEDEEFCIIHAMKFTTEGFDF